ncbi:MAG: InlB B-repeat-containing protein, partial [Anaeroplasmataceae bacterium]|nr:InlB B-repeat-containing protein [Anaeroplasmataceae bacterium]
YTFKGWSTNSTTYTAFDTTTKTITEHITLYAFFDINQYTVTFMNGSVKHDTQKVDYNDTVAIPANPTQTGKSFKGWSTSSTSYVAFNENTKITSDRTLYAFFITKYTVTFNVDGTNTSVEVEENAKVTKPEDPSKSGHSFVGWTYNGSEFNFNTPITENIELVASFVAVQIEISKYGAYDEGLFFEATPVSGASLSDYQVQYKLSTASNTAWNTVDSALVREENNKIRCDIVGLSAGTYDVKLDVNGKTETKSYEVTAADRSGYAHFNYSGVGAYNDDGTLKSDAIVVYVTNENKNTVSITVSGKTYTGLVNIIQNQSKIKKPLDIRIIGKITTNQYNYKSDAPRLPDSSNNTSTFFTNSLETTYGENLVGLTVQYMDKLVGKSYKYLTTTTGLASNGTGDSSKKTTTYSRDQYPALTGKTVLDDDSYFNMLDIELASNITIEGIGTNAEFFQFGLTWKKCNSIEVKNLAFTDYPEDACSFEAGSDSDVNDYGHYWIHNNTFNRGKNNWDVSGERDKYAGDGGIDVK